MKKHLFYFFVLLFCSTELFSQQLSFEEFFGLKNMPLQQIDSLMAAKNFSRFDTTVAELTFRFYGFSQQVNTIYNIRYIQIAIKENYNYPEIQYQTSIQKEALQWQQQLIAKGFSISETNNANTRTSYQNDKIIVDYLEEAADMGKYILYTFRLTDDKNYNNNLFKKSW